VRLTRAEAGPREVWVIEDVKDRLF
jgi:hypothetical protein